MRIYLLPIIILLIFVQATYISAKEWGPAVDNLHCRIELKKEIFLKGESIRLGFRIEPLKNLEKQPERSLPYKIEGLIENLGIKDPDGNKMTLKEIPKQSPGQLPKGEFYIVFDFDITNYYNFDKCGEYKITANYLLDVNNRTTLLKSQNISFVVIPHNLIINRIQSGCRAFKINESVPITIDLYTDINSEVDLENVEFIFRIGMLLSSSIKAISIPGKLILTKIPKTYIIDISSIGWYLGSSSMGPLSGLVTPGEKHFLEAELLGEYKGKRFAIKSNQIELFFE